MILCQFNIISNDLAVIKNQRSREEEKVTHSNNEEVTTNKTRAGTETNERDYKDEKEKQKREKERRKNEERRGGKVEKRKR